MKTHPSHHEPGGVVLAAWREQIEQAQEKPWLTALLLRQRERLLRRFAYFYERLHALPRNTRRTIQKRLATTLAGAALLLALAGPVVPAAHAATITVHPGSTGVNGSDGGCSLVEAILTANSGSYSSADCDGGTASADTITLSGNTYSYTAAYAGGENALPTISSEITIDSNSATIQRSGGSDFRILQVTSSGNLTLNYVTISGGTIASGGGIYNYGTVTLNNSTISGNSASYYGGGVYNYGTVTLNNSTVSGNSANYSGGGIYNYRGTATLNNSTISGNSANYYGGGIASSVGTVTLNNSTVSSNSTNYSGGGIADNFDTVALNNSTVSGNSADYSGGGIYNDHSTVTLDNSTVSGNSANYSGGGIYNYRSTVTLDNSTVSGNSANYSGGGIANNFDTVTLNNSTVSGNSVNGFGGGIYSAYGTVELNRSLISGNSASLNGDEIYDYYSIVNAGNYNVIGYGGSARSAYFTPPGTDVIPAGALDTVLNTTLADNGGPTFTHALVSGSVAVNTIPTTDASCDPGTTVDQRGAARADGVNRGGSACDSGAFEYASNQTPTAVTMSGFSAHGEGMTGPTAMGAAGVLALLTGGWLARVRRRKM